ncbi:uncharacterized protein LOC127851357 isoform X2 [Dreissena polymorpha]|nr:uncharacterized protein LOC127851357 isoform X2 [Dreissena polymorpha]XP_052241046.1 uncharacterized protein LOC127851357 isoform X2 [Dreissena polymorpha]XP_052241047.1 uncharacterized protein LOC127851357 isoform X2 [Dreissena polymorpha]
MMQTTINRGDDPVNSSDEAADNSNAAARPTRDEQSNMSDIEVTESDIDAIGDIGTAIRTCRRHKIVYQNLKNIDVPSLRILLKFSLLCKGTTRADIEDTLNKGQHAERSRMDTICALYKEAYHMITENGIIFSDILKFYQHFKTDFTNCIANLENYRSPILVLGETGAGKTSFINLLLGERLLPTSLLSNTHTICELRYSPSGNLEAEVEYVDKPREEVVKTFNDKDNPNTFLEILKAEAEKENVRKILLQGPFQMLKNNVVIVDSPGVGESEEIKNITLGYVEKASAFVYVIDMMNAGGVQQRMQEFIEEVKKKANEVYGVNLQKAIFVCNKWDEVPTHEKTTVIKDTVERLKQLWNGLDEKQIIPFSTTEAQWIQGQGAVAPNFRKVLDKLADLIPTAQYTTTLKAQTGLGKVLEKSLQIASTHIENSRLNEEQLRVKTTEAEKRLENLEEKKHVFISRQRENVKTRIHTEASKIYDRVNTDQIKDKVCSFEDTALPTDSTWNDAAANIRTQMFEKILKAMNLQNLAEHIEGQIKIEMAAEIPSFQSMLSSLQVKLSGREETLIEEKITRFLPEYVRKVYGKSVGMTILFTPAMPFIALIRMPVFLVQRFKESREMSAMEQKYITAKGRKEQIKEVSVQYAKYVFEHVVNKMEIQALATETMQVCYSRIDELENEMTQTLKSDRTFIRSFPDTHRDIQSGLAKIQEISNKLQRLKTEVDDCFKT